MKQIPKKLKDLSPTAILSLLITAILLFTIGITINNALTKQNQRVHASSDSLIIYNESLSKNWTAKNWYGDERGLSLDNTNSGKKAIAFTAQARGDEVDFLSNFPIDTSQYSTLSLSALIHTPAQNYAVRLFDQHHKPTGIELSLRNVDKNNQITTWKDYQFALSNFHAPSTIIGGFTIAARASTSLPSLYINQIAFTK